MADDEPGIVAISCRHTPKLQAGIKLPTPYASAILEPASSRAHACVGSSSGNGRHSGTGPSADALLDARSAHRRGAARCGSNGRLVCTMAFDLRNSKTLHCRGSGWVSHWRAMRVLPLLAEPNRRGGKGIAFSSGGLSRGCCRSYCWLCRQSVSATNWRATMTAELDYPELYELADLLRNRVITSVEAT